jgi:hypothetical protein
MMPTLCVRHAQPAHVFRKIVVPLWPNDQMPMIWHQNIAQQPHRYDLPSLFENPLEGGIIAVGFKNRSPARRAVQNMKDISTGSVTWSTWHSEIALPVRWGRELFSRKRIDYGMRPGENNSRPRGVTYSSGLPRQETVWSQIRMGAFDHGMK